jgi:hypothetical protein
MRSTARMGALVLVGLLAWSSQGFDKSVRGQAVGFQPVVGSFPSGTTLDVTPAVTADRRYVRLSVNPFFNNLLGFDTFSVPAAVTGGAGVNGAIGGLGGGGGGGGIGGGGGGGGAGGGGFRATGLGMPRVAGGGPVSGTAGFAGDPFARVLDQSSTMRSASPSASIRRDVDARPSSRANQTKAGAAPARGTAMARKTTKKRVRHANTSNPAADAAALDLGAGFFPFGP